MENKKEFNKKPLIIAAVSIDVIITVFLLVISIIMLVQTIGKSANDILNATGFIGYLQNHTTFYFCLFVLPLFILLALNIIGLVFYVRKITKEEDKSTSNIHVNDLSDAQREELKKQLLEDMLRQQSKKEETKNENEEKKGE